jgi:hypothetical protein
LSVLNGADGRAELVPVLAAESVMEEAAQAKAQESAQGEWGAVALWAGQLPSNGTVQSGLSSIGCSVSVA